MVILHGLFGAGRNWGAIARKLADRFHIYLVDLPNHGDSPSVEQLTYESMADAVAGFLRARGIYGDVCLIGHSMGGKTAMTLALSDAVAMQRLIVADIAPVPYRGHANGEIIDALSALPLERLKSRGEIDAALAPSVSDPMLRSYLLANLRRDGEGFSWRINLAGLKASLSALHAFPTFADGTRFDGPTLVIEGGRSDYIRTEDRPVMRRLFPEVRFETLPDAGHWVHADAPDAVSTLIANFMSA
ncbi:MAG: Alpha/beta hydrolase fold [Rhodospirillales bacterium]|nr:Alpha/beta hydrolase fold [Rhodospirillales bacterium]